MASTNNDQRKVTTMYIVFDKSDSAAINKQIDLFRQKHSDTILEYKRQYRLLNKAVFSFRDNATVRDISYVRQWLMAMNLNPVVVCGNMTLEDEYEVLTNNH